MCWVFTNTKPEQRSPGVSKESPLVRMTCIHLLHPVDGLTSGTIMINLIFHNWINMTHLWKFSISLLCISGLICFCKSFSGQVNYSWLGFSLQSPFRWLQSPVNSYSYVLPLQLNCLHSLQFLLWKQYAQQGWASPGAVEKAGHSILPLFHSVWPVGALTKQLQWCLADLQCRILKTWLDDTPPWSNGSYLEYISGPSRPS